MASEQPTDNEQPIKLKKFTVTLDLSPETARRLQEELPHVWESWLELKRDLLQREADQITQMLHRRTEAGE